MIWLRQYVKYVVFLECIFSTKKRACFSSKSRKIIHLSWQLWAKILVSFAFGFSSQTITTISDFSRGGSRTAAASKMKRYMIIVNGFQPLTIITKRSISDVAAVLDPPLIRYDIGRMQTITLQITFFSEEYEHTA